LKNKVIKISFIIIFSALILLAASFLIYFFTLNREIDLSMIKKDTSSITRIYYFDYEDRKERLGEPRELENEAIFSYKSEWTPLYDMPKNLVNAFIAVEDKRFYSHSGVDFLRTGKAIFNYLFSKNKTSFGGSTITQQFIKNLTGENEATPKRKINEIFRALNLESKMSKNEILEAYLNVVYLSQKCYGVGAGAKMYFNKEISDLSLSECASLAAIVKNPSSYNPYKGYKNNLSRRNLVLKQMLEQGYIDDEEYIEAVNESIEINSEIEKESGQGIFSWFTELLLSDVSRDLAKKKNISEENARVLILRGGYNIYATIDPKIQDIMEKAYESSEYFTQKGAPQSASVAIDPYTGDILGVIGGKGKKTANLIFNRAKNAKRPPGSVIKPLSVYAPAIDKNLVTYTTAFEDSPVKIENGVPWPKNSPDKYRGNIPVYYALAHSVNTVAVKILKELGINSSFNYLDKFGISYDKNLDANESSLALGQLTNGASLLDVTNAYSAFVNDGKICTPRSYLYVTDNKGDTVLEAKASEREVISKESSFIMRKMLENVVSEGTASSLSLDNKLIEIGGKTGSSSSFEDRWFVGFTPDYVIGVWTGYDTPRTILGVQNPSLSIFGDVINNIYEENEEGYFNNGTSLMHLDVCLDSGLIANKGCERDERGSRIIHAYYKKGTEPTEKCKNHVFTYFDKKSGERANIFTPFFRRRRVYFYRDDAKGYN
jgi:penicillin-binding protein 1A